MIRQADRGTASVSFHNPSIRDYLDVYIKKDPSTLDALLARAISIKQITNLWESAGGLRRLSDRSFEIMVDSFLRLSDSAYPPAELAKLALKIINVRHDSRVADLANTLLRDIKEHNYNANSDELLRLARRLAYADVGPLNSYLPYIAQRAADRLIPELFSFSDIDGLSLTIKELKRFGAIVFEDDLADKKREIASDELDRFVDARRPEDVNVEELEEVVYYWRSSQDETHPGVEGAEAYLDAYVHDEEEPVVTPAETDDDAATIDAMFRTLRQDPS
jgi:hypothetical protein